MQEMEYEQASEEQYSQETNNSEELSEDLHAEKVDITQAPFGLEEPLRDFFLNAEHDHVTVVYDDVPVGVSDLQQDINQFIFQQRAFAAFFEPDDEVVPAVSLSVHNETLLVPVDLDLQLETGQLSGLDSRRLDPRLEDLHRTFDLKYATTTNLLSDSGLQVNMISQEDATSSFFRGLSNFFLTRWAALRHNALQAGPPLGELVSVETDQDRQLVLHTRGYFLSTSALFAYSTPARRFIPHGTYVFGIHTPNGPWFLDVLFDVPPHTEIYLSQP